MQQLSSESFFVYVAPRGFEDILAQELGRRVLTRRGRLFLARRGPEPVWAQNAWLSPEWIPIASVGDAVRRLKAVQRNWCLHPVDLFRRAKLIQSQLPHVSAKRLPFGAPAPTGKLGAWTLWEENLILASARTSSPFPDGEVEFEENKTDPPGRAYLKLWEVFTLIGTRPAPGELCLDLGASPGGWSWVLGSIGASVFALDKAPLAPNVAAMPTVESCIGSGFGLEPEIVGRADWLFSDMICYPERLYECICRWQKLGLCRNYVCTLKFQAETDFAVMKQFAALPGSRIFHLSHNKHEVTWVNLEAWR